MVFISSNTTGLWTGSSYITPFASVVTRIVCPDEVDATSCQEHMIAIHSTRVVLIPDRIAAHHEVIDSHWVGTETLQTLNRQTRTLISRFPVHNIFKWIRKPTYALLPFANEIYLTAKDVKWTVYVYWVLCLAFFNTPPYFTVICGSADPAWYSTTDCQLYPSDIRIISYRNQVASDDAASYFVYFWAVLLTIKIKIVDRNDLQCDLHEQSWKIYHLVPHSTMVYFFFAFLNLIAPFEPKSCDLR